MKTLAVTSTRRSTRISAKGKGPSESRKLRIEKRKPSTNGTASKLKIDKVLDFKKSTDALQYLVHVEGSSDNAWVTESIVENLDVLTSYKKQVETDSGYSVEQEVVDVTENNSIKRPSRFSKTRALVAMKQPINLDDSDGEDFAHRGTKRKSNKVGGSTRKASNKLSSGGKIRKTKAQLLLEAELQERLKRQRERSNLDADAIVNELGHVYGKDCCLMCAASDYRRYLEDGDLNGFKALFENWKNIPSYHEEDTPNGLDLIGYAIILEKFEFAEFAAKFKHDNKLIVRPSVPVKYKEYGDTTGFNVGYHGRQVFRQVQESRGNRLGNSAFYSETKNKATFLNVENDITECGIRHYFPFITNDVFKKPTVIDNFLNFDYYTTLTAYFAVNAGNRDLALKVISRDNYAFNHLHEEVLKFNGNRKLTNYKRPQILKFASSACNLTPYHCAAIHPSANYLEEFYTALDVAERLETDGYGRDVTFYAAVSETSDCLEFLISKGCNINLFDKFKLTPLVQAARFGRSHNVEILIKQLNGGADATDISESTYKTLNRNRRTALHYAAYFGHPETCRILINYHAPVEALENLDKQTPLHYAAKNGNLECVRVLVEEGNANPEKGDKYSRTPLQLACIAGHIDVVKYLLSIGVNADAGDSSDNHPVHYAAAFGRLEILHLLVEYGNANPSAFNVWRNTACSIANTKGHTAIVKYLLGLKGSPIDVNSKDQEGLTILQHAIQETITSEIDMELVRSRIELLVSMKADPNSADLEGHTSLHILAQQTAFTKLYAKGRTSFYPSETSYYSSVKPTPYGFDDIEGVEYTLSIARLLLKHGADLNVKSQKNETPLSIAMRNKNHHLVALFIEEGARFWIDTDNEGNNFYHYFGNLAAYISRFQPHCEDDEVCRKRFLDVAKKIWDLVELKLTSNMDLTSIMNSVNNKGYPAIISSIQDVIHHQRAKLTREKKLIKSEVSRLLNNNNFHGYDIRLISSKQAESVTGMIDVDLRFDFSIFIGLMERFLVKIKPNLNMVVALPKDFLKNNPKAKKSDYPAWTGYTALHFACQTQAGELIEFLLRHGADPNVKINAYGHLDSTPIIIGYHSKHDKKQELVDDKPATLEKMRTRFNITKPDYPQMKVDTLSTLIRYGASPYITNAAGKSALSKAVANADIDTIDIMCNAIPFATDDINAKNKEDRTVLMVALAAKESVKNIEKDTILRIFKKLLNVNADPNALYEDGDNVIMKALRLSYADIVKAIIEDSQCPINHNHQNKKHDTALSIACKINDPEILPLYLSSLKSSLVDTNHFDSVWCTPLSYVCRNGNLQAARSLLSLGANPTHCKPQNVPLIEAVKSGNIELVSKLLLHGAFVSQCDSEGNSSLHIAVLCENSRLVDYLLKLFADPNATNNKAQTPLHLAIEKTKNQANRSFRVERSLLSHGADLNVVDFFNRTPLHYVFIDSNVIPITKDTIVMKKKTDLLALEAGVENAKRESLKRYVDMFSLNEPDYYNNGKINYWLKEMKQTQIEKEAAEKEKKKKKENQIVLFEEEKEKLRGFNRYSWENATTIAERFDPIDIAKYLLHFEGVQLDVPDCFGRTPLHYAARVGAFSCTNLMVEKGVNLSLLDTDNNGALQLALRNNHVDYSLMLFNNGAKLTKTIVLQNGEEASTFGFSLSKSLINIAYLVMDSGISLIELISDALINGKFHMAEVILQTSEEKALCQTISETGKNLWHAVAGFMPFDSKTWEDDYLDEFVTKLSTLNISFKKDKSGKSPLHYAAKNHQAGLLKRFISMKDVSVSDYDNQFISILEYAVGSRKLDSVKQLLDSGAIVSKHELSKGKSALLIAVENSDYLIAEELLKFGAKTDDKDTENQWTNSIMTACLRKDLKMANLLIQFNAELDKPSNITFKDKKLKQYSVLMHPIFIASEAGEEFLKAFLEAGADPNVQGPKSEEKYAKSCFMYNVDLYKANQIQMLLDYNINMDYVNPETSRSIFFEIFFSKMVKNGGYKDSQTKLASVPEEIFEKIIAKYTPSVNIVDAITGMSPLEAAIKKNNSQMVQRLMAMGADVNLESCGDFETLSIGNLMNISRNALPAILHALLQNRIEILEAMCVGNINWLWQDSKGNNMLSYAIGALTDFSYTRIGPLLTFIRSKTDNKTFKKLLKMKNIKGLSPAMYAYHRKNKFVYNTLLKFDNSLQSYIDKNFDISLFDSDEAISPMEVDGISMQEVENYAQIERENLREEKRLEDIQNGKPNTLKEDEALIVDPYSKLSKIATVELCESTSIPYNITLMKTEIRSWGNKTDTSIYNLAIYLNKLLDIYVLWTRWGPLGQEGQHQKTPYLTKEAAVAEFKAIFKSKTGNAWETHKDAFEVKPGRYEILKKSHHPRDIIIKNFDFLKSNVESELPSEVLDVLKLICNFKYLSKVYNDTRMDMPFGQIPQSRIEEARALLKETVSLIDKYEELRTSYTDRSKIAQSHLYAFKIANKCVAYSRLLPRHGESNKAIRSLYDHEKKAIYKELAKIDDLSYVGFAADVVLAAKHHVDKINPLDYAYRTLDCTLRSIPTSMDSPEYVLIRKYMESTSDQFLDVVHLFAVNRAEEQTRYRPYENDSNRKLLWHGSRIGNFMGILKQGLRVAPGTTDNNGALLGSGVYFADTFAKSLSYTTDYYGDVKSPYKLMLLCEVALGTNQGRYINKALDDYSIYDSIHGQGRQVPDPNSEIYDSNNVCIPIGPCCPYYSESDSEGFPHLNFNEFTVNNVDRVKIKYLLVLRESNSCYLCSSSASLSPLTEHDVSKYDFSKFNSYEREIVKSYLFAQNKTAQDIYSSELDQLLHSKSYKKICDTPLDMQKDDKICKECCFKLVSSMLENYIVNNKDSSEILAAVNQRPRCKYGRECRTQEKLSHSKHYSHWLFDKFEEALKVPMDIDGSSESDSDKDNNSDKNSSDEGGSDECNSDNGSDIEEDDSDNESDMEEENSGDESDMEED